ncbi:hypothetical protein LIER_23060 [Lithospermum erythrorhizon]|uniref:Reverse transcriptase domain-containing protein n=1 Tax=Lithospermum erythrorhizon TaxID=34254 RepID=A0AAV3QZ42_LITER
MFADDTLLLGYATTHEAEKIMNILNTYESWSGQLVNVQKSTIMFSPNVSGPTREAISAMLDMTEVNSHGKYLGLPTTIGSFKKEVFNTIVDRVKAKVANWKSRLLPAAGKEVFIMSVLQSIPTFTMQCFRLPVQICKEINFILSNFGWRSDTTNKRKIHWLSWQQLCKPKGEGGLGFRDTLSFNQALLCKQAWKLITEPTSPLSQLFKARYYPQTSFWDAELGAQPSYTWRSILSCAKEYNGSLDGKKLEPESNVLLVFATFGPVLKIAMFDKNGEPETITSVQPAAVTTSLMGSHPSTYVQQPQAMGGPSSYPYNGAQYAPPHSGVFTGPPQPSGGWNPAASAVNPPMHMHHQFHRINLLLIYCEVRIVFVLYSWNMHFQNQFLILIFASKTFCYDFSFTKLVGSRRCMI